MLLPLALCAMLLACLAPAHSQQSPRVEAQHDKAFLRMIIKNDYKVPAGTSASAPGSGAEQVARLTRSRNPR
jgi:hypothetical protein